MNGCWLFPLFVGLLLLAEVVVVAPNANGTIDLVDVFSTGNTPSLTHALNPSTPTAHNNGSTGNTTVAASKDDHHKKVEGLPIRTFWPLLGAAATVFTVSLVVMVISVSQLKKVNREEEGGETELEEEETQ